MSKSKPAGRSRELLALFGSTGTGKTTIGRHLVSTRGPAAALVLDRLGLFPTSFSAGFSQRVFTDAAQLVATVRACVEQGMTTFRFSLVPPRGAEPVAAGYLCRLAKWASEAGGVESWVVLEEAANACKHGLVDPATIECAQDGRHFGVSMAGLSQRPVGIDPDVRAELGAGELWLGRLVDWNDSKALGGRLGREKARALASLPTVKDNGHSVWLRLAEGQSEPESWTLRFRGSRPEISRSDSSQPAASEVA